MTSTDPPRKLLRTRDDWLPWYVELRTYATELGAWTYIDPDAPEKARLDEPEFPTPQEARAKLTARATQEYEAAQNDYAALEASQKQLRQEPQLVAVTEQEVAAEYDRMRRDYAVLQTSFANANDRRGKITEWVRRSVDPGLHSAALMTNLHGTPGVRATILQLRTMLAPSNESAETHAAELYLRQLERAKRPGINVANWYREFNEAYQMARAFNVVELNGIRGVKRFLEAIRERIAVKWGSQQLQQASVANGLGKPFLTLDEFVRRLGILIQDNIAGSSYKGKGIYSTPNLPAAGNGGEKNDRAKDEGGHDCPCRERNARKYRWTPENCVTLRKAVTGQGDPRVRATKPTLDKIRVVYQRDRWKDLREKLDAKWRVEKEVQGGGAQDAYPGSVVAIAIDPNAIGELHNHFSIFSTPSGARHALADSTVIDSCGATHLVNSRDLLVPGSFVPTAGDDCVEAGTTTFPISGRGTRKLEKALDGRSGKNTEPLELTEVAVVEGFHTNIISEPRLRKAGVWYCGFDCTLRFGDLNRSVKIKQLERRFNLTFFEYKPISHCSIFPLCIPVSSAGIVSYETSFWNVFFTARDRRSRTRALPGPREDTEELWHLRAGHLGPEALRALVKNVRNVKIRGTPLIDCASCSLAHAQNVVSRVRSSNRSTRPFWRVGWDLYNFPRARDGSNWVLLIKDEFGGRWFPYIFPDKTQQQVWGAIRNFDAWVRRQFGLPICKMRHDNEASVIASGGNALTAFQRWLLEEGIESEPSPSNTHEPNGNVEKGGGDLQKLVIKMLNAANLPEDLWPETVYAACHLHAISPSQAHGFKSPNEIMYSWFKRYFRWYAPSIALSLAADLRPDWSGIFAYGCRAYPLDKDREAGVGRRRFKVQPRGQIGYLVGYRARNIYRIWIPKLDRVITTRNVTFDEYTFYRTGEELEGMPASIANKDADLLDQEGEIWDARSISQALLGMDDEPILDSITVATNPPRQPGQNSGVGELLEENASLPAATEKLDSGRNLLEEALGGLLTPEKSPEVAPQSSGGDAPSVSEETLELEIPFANSSESGDGALTESQSHEVAVSEREDETGPSGVDTGGEGDSGVAGFRDAHQERAPGGAGAPEQADRGGPSRRGRRGWRVQVQEPTRSSSRIRNRRNAQIHFVQSGNSPQFEATFFERAFFETFLPDHQEALHAGEKHRTMHAVFAAAVQQHRADRLGAAPGRPRLHMNDLLHPPKHWRELDRHQMGSEFKQAAQEEIQNLESRGTWKEIPRHEAQSRPIPLKWVFDYKFDPDGYLQKCKSRICVRGDLQDTSSLESTYAATLAARSFRTMMAIAAHFDLEVKQLDVAQAFLNADRPEGDPVVCELPDGFRKPGMCVELRKALYGLVDSPLLWYREFCNTLGKLGMSPSKEEPCLFLSADKKIIIVFYVDDILIFFYRNNEVAA